MSKRQTWYLLYGGTSADGMGPGVYKGRTTSKAEARAHNKAVYADPYSTGYVDVVTDRKITRMAP